MTFDARPYPLIASWDKPTQETPMKRTKTKAPAKNSRKLVKQKAPKPISQQLLNRQLLENPPETAHIIGYARVSTADQILDVQMRALNDMGCDPIFAEKASAGDLRRPQFSLLRKFVEPGDTIVFHSYSRISRKLKDLLTFVDDMREMGVRLISVTEPGINPYSAGGKLQLSIIGAADEHERSRVRDRTSMAMQEKIKQGQYIGRPVLVDAADAAKMKKLRAAGVPVETIAVNFKVSKSTVYQCTAKKPK